MRLGARVVITLMLVSSMAAMGAISAVARQKAVDKAGDCSDASTWKFTLDPDDGKIEVEFEVDQNVNGEDWKVVLKHNGDRFFSHTKTTKAPSGSFSVNRKVNNASGTDKVTVRATNLSSGEVCKAQGSL